MASLDRDGGSAEPALHLRALRRRWPLLLALTIVTTAVALAVSLTAEKQYDATAQLLLTGDEPVTSLLSGGTGGSDDPERELQTGVELITAGGTVHEVRRRLRLTRSTDELAEQVSTDTRADSDIADLTARDRDPRLAADIANAFAEAYVRFRTNQARERYLQAARLADQQLRALSRRDRAGDAGRTLRARRDELRITAALQTGGAEVVRRASVPEDPARPRPVLSAVVGLALGLALGFALVVALELVDRRLRDERDVEEAYGLPVIAAIPAGARQHTLAGRAQREAYGLLAANLRFSTLAATSNVLVVSSSGPAEGKTSVTLGVARALARLGLSVIAVEADLRRPAFAQRVGLVPSAGLTGVLSGHADLERELVEVDADTLEIAHRRHEGGTFRVLQAGEPPANPQGALSAPRAAAVVDAASDLADVLIIDTAPVGTVNDALPLLQHADGILLVARLNHSTREAARRALRALRGVQVPVVGVVVAGATVPAAVGMEYYARHDAPRKDPAGVEQREP